MPDVDLNPGTARWIERAILYTLMGLAAERRFTGRNDWRGARGDTEVAVDIASFLYPFGSPVLEKYMAFMIERARMFVSRSKNWIRIEALAVSLLERRTLSAREAKELCRQALWDSVKALRNEGAIQTPQAPAGELVPGEAAQRPTKRKAGGK